MTGRTKAWWWVAGAVVAMLVVAVVVILLARDDSDDSDDAPPATSTSRASTTTVASTTTPPTTTTAPTTTTTVPYPVITDDPQTYAEYLFAAWQNGDRTAAAEVASGEAVTEMFSRAYPAQGPYTFANCGPAAGSLYCTWNGQNGATIQMTVRTLTGGLPVQVQAVAFSP